MITHFFKLHGKFQWCQTENFSAQKNVRLLNIITKKTTKYKTTFYSETNFFCEIFKNCDLN